MCTNTTIDPVEELGETQQVGIRLKTSWINGLRAKALHESVRQGRTILYTDLIRDAIKLAYLYD